MTLIYILLWIAIGFGSFCFAHFKVDGKKQITVGDISLIFLSILGPLLTVVAIIAYVEKHKNKVVFDLDKFNEKKEKK